jgi:hypothetical protein
MPGVEEEDDVCVGFKYERESKEVGIREFILVSGDGRETDEGVKEGEVVRGDVAIVERVDGPDVVVDNVPAWGDDDNSQEHDSEGVVRDVVPDADAQSSWNGGLFRDRRGRSDSELNLKRPSPPGKVKSNMTNL